MKEFKFRDEDIKTFEAIRLELASMAKKKEISEETLRSLTNMISSLEGLKESIYWKYLNSVKKD